ncbi:MULTISPECIES: hypothetical protein [Proteiniclasticum]|uniref:hypothetical protein n=1 Tax=Proteiniclasticum TaxID=1155385 RepID=UPI00289B53CB|nr:MULTISPECIES: hypothetical protein [Proteiniclasticum]
MSFNIKSAYFSFLLGGISLVAAAEEVFYDGWILMVALLLISAGVALYDGFHRMKIEKKFRKLYLIEDVEEKSVFHEADLDTLLLYRILIMVVAMLTAAACVLSFIVVRFHYVSLFLAFYMIRMYDYLHQISKVIEEKKWANFLLEYKNRGYE